MIKIYFPQGTIEERRQITFAEIQELVAQGSGQASGMVQMVPGVTAGVPWQACCNEDGMQYRLPFNEIATHRFASAVNLGPGGALGVWVLLTGKDMLK